MSPFSIHNLFKNNYREDFFIKNVWGVDVEVFFMYLPVAL